MCFSHDKMHAEWRYIQYVTEICTVWYVCTEGKGLQFNTEYDKEEDIQKLSFQSIRNNIYCKFTSIHLFGKCKFTAERSVIVPDCGMALLSCEWKAANLSSIEHALIQKIAGISLFFRS